MADRGWWELVNVQKLENDVAQLLTRHYHAGICWQPEAHGYTPMINSIYNS